MIAHCGCERCRQTEASYVALDRMLKEKELQIAELRNLQGHWSTVELALKDKEATSQLKTDFIACCQQLKDVERLYDEVLDLLNAHGRFVCYYSIPTQPPNACGTCASCKLNAIRDKTEKRKDEAPKCSVCKEPIGDGFAIRKAAWCEKCEGYSHNNCWAAHNLTYCRR